MSLLMDALKRAETSKQEATRNLQGRNSPKAGDALSLEPLPPEAAKAPAASLPDLAAHLDAVDADLTAAAQRHTRPSPPPARKPAPEKVAEPREAVRNAFAAKQPEATASRQPLWLALGTLGVAGIAIGAYVWYQMNTMNRGSLAVSPQPAATAAAPQPTVASPPALPLAPASDFAASDRSTVASTTNPATPPLFPRQEPRPTRPMAASPDMPSAPPIRLTRTRPEPDSYLSRGHASLQRGEIDLARREFEHVLHRDPNNSDALIALAAIAQRQGRPADADGLRQRALIANPADPATQAAALNSPASDADPSAAESRLKTLLSSQPESAPLNFALGNLYARQSRWPEAQQAYFNTVAAEGDNPDYLFNLAVSLDHLRQSRLAAQHYRLALEAAVKRPAGFDRDKIQKRLSELQPERQP